MTKTLFLEIKSDHGTTEVWDVDDATMAELGWVRANGMGVPDLTPDVYERGVRDGMRAQADLVAKILAVTGKALVVGASGDVVSIATTAGVVAAMSGETAPEPIGHTDSGDPVHATNGTTLKPVVAPCERHMFEIDASCPACYHWHNRDEKPAGEVVRIERPNGKLPSDRLREIASAGPLKCPHGTDEHPIYLDHVISLLDEQHRERLGRGSGT